MIIISIVWFDQIRLSPSSWRTYYPVNCHSYFSNQYLPKLAVYVCRCSCTQWSQRRGKSVPAFFTFSYVLHEDSSSNPVLPWKKKIPTKYSISSLSSQSSGILYDQHLVPLSSNHELPRYVEFWKALLVDWPNTQHTFMCNVIPCFFVLLTCLSPDAVALLLAHVLITFLSSSNSFVRVCIDLDCISPLRHSLFVVNLEIESFLSSLSHVHDQLRLPEYSTGII